MLLKIFSSIIIFANILKPTLPLAEAPIKLGTNIGLGILPLIAEKEGYFKEEGLDVQIKELNVAKVVMDSLVSGDIDFGTTLDSNLSFFGFAENNLKIVTSLGERAGDAIYFKKQSRIHSASDLKGKRIAYIPGSVSQIFLSRLLTQNGIKWSEITPVTIQPQLGGLVLRNDSVDAVSIWHTFGHPLKKEFGDAVDTIESSKDIYPSQIYLLATSKTLTKSPEKTMHLVSALRKAGKLLKENPEKSFSYLAKRFEADEKDLPSMLARYDFEAKDYNKGLSLIKENGEWIKANVDDYRDRPTPKFENYFSEVLKETTPLVDVKFCHSSNLISSLVYIANEKSFFKEEGINPLVEIVSNGKLCLDMLVAKRTDLIISGEAPLTYLAPLNPPVKLLASVQLNPEIGLFVRKDSGIKGFSDLSGKKIAYLPGTTSYFFLSRILNKNSIKKQDVKLSPMQPQAMSQALIGGAVNGFVIWEPWGSNAESQLKDNFLRFQDPEAYRPIGLLATHNEFIKNNGAQIEKVMRSIVRASNFMKTNNDEAFEILKNVIKYEDSTFKRLWPLFDHSVQISNKIVEQMDENFKILVAEDQNFKNVETPNFKSFIESKYLKMVDPKLVKDGL